MQGAVSKLISLPSCQKNMRTPLSALRYVHQLEWSVTYVTRLVGWFIGRDSNSELPTGRGLYILLYGREDQPDKRRTQSIGRGGPVEWLSWLTDLTSTNFFFCWGFVKYKCSSVVSDKRRAQYTDHRGLYLLRTLYYSKLAAGSWISLLESLVALTLTLPVFRNSTWFFIRPFF